MAAVPPPPSVEAEMNRTAKQVNEGLKEEARERARARFINSRLAGPFAPPGGPTCTACKPPR
jgi:hypothetical protein